MAAKARELKQAGLDVISMSLGEPDFPTPAHVKQAVKDAVDADLSHYGPVPGTPGLRAAAAKYMSNFVERQSGDEDTFVAEDIIVSVGAKQAICNAIETIVSKGSVGCVEGIQGDWVLVRLTPYGVKGNFVCPDFGPCYCGWFKSDVLKGSLPVAGTIDGILVRFSNGGVGLSIPALLDEDGFYYFKDSGDTRISADCYKNVKTTGKVWLHKTPSLSNSYGKALMKDKKVKYRRCYSFDTRGVMFYGVRYEGKCLWVSSLYSKLVK